MEEGGRREIKRERERERERERMIKDAKTSDNLSTFKHSK